MKAHNPHILASLRQGLALWRQADGFEKWVLERLLLDLLKDLTRESPDYENPIWDEIARSIRELS